jgi:hypothetical protein
VTSWQPVSVRAFDLRHPVEFLERQSIPVGLFGHFRECGNSSAIPAVTFHSLWYQRRVLLRFRPSSSTIIIRGNIAASSETIAMRARIG